MKQLLPWSLVVLLAGILVFSHLSSTWEATATGAEQKKINPVYKKGWAVYEIKDLLKKRKKSGRAWMPFLRVPALYCGIYSLPKNGKDGQSPHRDDEVYYVLSGKGKIQTGSGDKQKTTAFQQGAVIYIKAGIAHRFVDISEDLELLVFFSTARPQKKGVSD